MLRAQGSRLLLLLQVMWIAQQTTMELMVEARWSRQEAVMTAQLRLVYLRLLVTQAKRALDPILQLTDHPFTLWWWLRLLVTTTATSAPLLQHFQEVTRPTQL